MAENPNTVLALVGKCQHRVSICAGRPGLLLVCQIGDRDEVTRPHWTCTFYEYEPGSLG